MGSTGGGPRNVAGAVVRDGDLWGRDDDLDRLWQRLERGSVLLTAPRRHGKTSLMQALDAAPRGAWVVDYVDVESVEDPREFLIELTAQVLTHHRLRGLVDSAKRVVGRLGRWLGAVADLGLSREQIGELKVSLRAGLGDGDSWAELTEQLLALIDGVGAPVLLIIDEFPMMVANFLDDDRARAVHFLRWFRALRQRRTGGRVRFLLGGSVNIEPRLERIGEQALLADLERFAVEPMSRPHAAGFVAAVLEAEGQAYEVGVPREIVRVADCGVFFFLQVLIQECLGEARRLRRELEVRDVEPVFRDRVLGSANRAPFSHYETRLRAYYGDREAAARVVLDELVRSQPLTLRQLADALARADESTAQLEDTVALLEGDYYIERDGERVRFANGFLRAWWLRHAARTKGWT